MLDALFITVGIVVATCSVSYKLLLLMYRPNPDAAHGARASHPAGPMALPRPEVSHPTPRNTNPPPQH